MPSQVSIYRARIPNSAYLDASLRGIIPRQNPKVISEIRRPAASVLPGVLEGGVFPVPRLPSTNAEGRRIVTQAERDLEFRERFGPKVDIGQNIRSKLALMAKSALPEKIKTQQLEKVLGPISASTLNPQKPLWSPGQLPRLSESKYDSARPGGFVTTLAGVDDAKRMATFVEQLAEAGPRGDLEGDWKGRISEIENALPLMQDIIARGEVDAEALSEAVRGYARSDSLEARRIFRAVIRQLALFLGEIRKPGIKGESLRKARNAVNFAVAEGSAFWEGLDFIGEVINDLEDEPDKQGQGYGAGWEARIKEARRDGDVFLTGVMSKKLGRQKVRETIIGYIKHGETRDNDFKELIKEAKKISGQEGLGPAKKKSLPRKSAPTKARAKSRK